MAGKKTHNKDLAAAKLAKKDEFYTQLTDIEKELKDYRDHFKGKTVLCNCDDPFESNFFKYFVLNFNQLGLKKLIATCYISSPIANSEMPLFDLYGNAENQQSGNQASKPYKAIVTVVYDKTGDGSIDMFDVAELFRSGENELTELVGDGDFRSEECLALLDEADIVVTNPPFSLFREYIAILIEHEKRFIIIGNVNAVKYKEVFPLFMSNKLWLGVSIHSGDRAFYVPDDYPLDAASCGVDPSTGRKFIRVKGVRWFTNLDIKQRHEKMILVKKYDPYKYPKYVNYDAIEVSKTADIPCDYSGKMGVPITFMDVYNPDQFEILGMNWTVLADAELSDDIRDHHNVARRLNFYLPVPDGSGNDYSRMYDRIVIRNKHPEPPKEN